MYHRINLDMLVMTDNPPEPTLEALTLFLMEQTQCIANVTVTPMVAQCTAMPFTPPPTTQICNNSLSNDAPPHANTNEPNSRPHPVASPDPVSPTPTQPPTPKRSAKPISKLVRMSEDSDRIARIVVERNHKYPRYYSHNDSWLSIRTNGRHYYYDSVTTNAAKRTDPSVSVSAQANSRHCTPRTTTFAPPTNSHSARATTDAAATTSGSHAMRRPRSAGIGIANDLGTVRHGPARHIHRALHHPIHLRFICSTYRKSQPTKRKPTSSCVYCPVKLSSCTNA